MNASVEQLVNLQAIDIEIDKLQKEITQIPQIINNLEEDFEHHKKHTEDLKKELNAVQVDKKNKEIELDSKNSATKKHQTELYAVKDNKAYTTLQNEINTLKKGASGIEDEILQMLDTIDDLNHKLKEGQQHLQKQEEMMKDEVEKLGDREKFLSEALSVKKEEREKAVAGIPPTVLKQYEQVRKKKQGLAIVEIKYNNCGGCHMNLTLQLVNEVRKGRELVCCENCLRIHYLKQEG
ncbi:MAG: C4-type zinc ribbon domain-containing protein [bacterium]